MYVRLLEIAKQLEEFWCTTSIFIGQTFYLLRGLNSKPLRSNTKKYNTLVFTIYSLRANGTTHFNLE